MDRSDIRRYTDLRNQIKSLTDESDRILDSLFQDMLNKIDHLQSESFNLQSVLNSHISEVESRERVELQRLLEKYGD